MSCTRQCFDKDHPDFGKDDCSTCSGADQGPMIRERGMSDIVERLRKSHSNGRWASPVTIYSEAADTIEQLQARVKELEENLHRAIKQRDMWDEANSEARAQLSAEQEKNAKLRELQEKSPLGRNSWHHGNGVLCCGTLRIAREDFDTSPSEKFRAELFDWIVAMLNSEALATTATDAMQENKG